MRVTNVLAHRLSRDLHGRVWAPIEPHGTLRSSYGECLRQARTVDRARFRAARSDLRMAGRLGDLDVKPLVESRTARRTQRLDSRDRLRDGLLESVGLMGRPCPQ